MKMGPKTYIKLIERKVGLIYPKERNQKKHHITKGNNRETRAYPKNKNVTPEHKTEKKQIK